ncbi:hypothetical protein [Undibacterium sp. TJN19]|uniref:hypothetical protein n=1 Tax=Undibacterium sp. TJN19 TaxID=3413055 RepID=UPI003BF29200
MTTFKNTWRGLIMACLVTAGINTNPALAETAPVWQRVSLHVADKLRAYDFPVYANHDLKADLTKIRHVIFVQHGIQRNGDDYFAAAMQLLKTAGLPDEQVLIIAPNFPGTPDQAKGFDRMPVWSVQGWTGGDFALAGAATPAQLSSLSVLDDLALMLADKARLPLLEKITFAGHSGGGQLMHRYAVLNHVDERLRSNGIAVQYVIANPSSYLYFTPERPTAGGGFVPYDARLCAAYDDYRYGMQQMVAYANKMSAEDLYRRHMQRHVTYLVGSKDNDPNHRVLDKSCGAEAEGPNRYERAHAYWQYETYLAKKLPPVSPARNTSSDQPLRRYFDVIGIGHDQEGMFGSQCGLQAVFGVSTTGNAKSAACKVVTP